MAEYIDKDKLLDVAYRLIVPEAFEAMENIANSIPVADVVEVVRCKDCKHYQKAPKGFVYGSCDYMPGHIDIDENDFCSKGERKGEDNG